VQLTSSSHLRVYKNKKGETPSRHTLGTCVQRIFIFCGKINEI
jgi:hypothetical protein